MIRAIIVDDESKGAKTLEILLQKYCRQVNILGLYESVAQASEAMRKLKPELLFLDIEMPFGNGFQLLEQNKDYQYEVIFTTAYNHYAINAIKAEAVDYLLKPIDIDELIAAVAKAEKRLTKAKALASSNIEQAVNQLIDNRSKRLSFTSNEGVLLVNPYEISCFEADSNYTYVHFDSKKKMTLSKTLKTFEKMVEGLNFLRVHHSYIINLDQVDKYIRGDGGTLVMKNGQTIPVSRSYKNDLLIKIGQE
ncbi:MAG: LytR/AlgR family response regulator transcription factor [Bacteroidia bacterium]